MQKKLKNIVLPLTLGLSSISTKIPSQRLSTLNIQINLTIHCKLLKALYSHSSSSKVKVKDVKYEGQSINLTCSQIDSKGEYDKCIGVGVEDKEDQIYLLPFKLNFIKQGEELILSIQKEIVDFLLYPVPRSKFVKNQYLQQIIKGREQTWGPLTMDKSQRIMLQSHQTIFPIIGLWINSSYPLSHTCNIINLLSYITQKSNKKCFFLSQGRKFFYLVKLNLQKKCPQLFLIQSKFQTNNKKFEKKIKIHKKDVFTKSQIYLTSDEKVNLEFTLRSDEKLPQTLINLSCSPIKFPLEGSYDEITRSSLPDSPRFRLDKCEIVQQEKNSLRRLVKLQQIQINQLKAEVLKLTGELKQCKKYKYCQRDELTQSYLSVPHHSLDTKSRLTRSDLNYEEPSINNCEEDIHKIDCIKQNVQQNVWDRFQIIQK